MNLLYRENDKENKIDKNANNKANYLNFNDICNDIPMNNNEFPPELKEIKKLNI